MRRALVVVMSTLLIGLGLVTLAAPGLAAPSAPRSEEEDYQDISRPLVYLKASNPANPSTCKATVLVAFQDLKGWDAIYMFTASYGAYPGEPPYADTYTMYPGVVWTAPAGTHWAKVSEVPGSASGPTDCSDVSLAQQQSHGATGTMTYKITDECDFARTDVRDAEKALKKAKKKVANTTGTAHDKAVVALKKAKKALKKAKKQFAKNCSE